MSRSHMSHVRRRTSSAGWKSPVLRQAMFRGERLHGTVLRNQGARGFVGRGEGGISNEQLGHRFNAHEIKLERYGRVIPPLWFAALREVAATGRAAHASCGGGQGRQAER